MQTESSSSTDLAIDGMTCSGCARTVAAALEGVAGVASAAVSLEANRASVHWRSGAETDGQRLVRAVQQAGYAARLVAEPAHEFPQARARTWAVNVLAGIVPTGVLMLGEWVLGWQHSPAARWVAGALATVVLLGPGLHFYKGAWRQLRVGASNMDTLVALGSTTAYVFSAWVLVTGRAAHLYFMEAASIITLISIGHWLEARVSARASGSLRALMNLAPPLALRRDSAGTEQSVTVAELVPGDVVVLRPGDRVPTDSEVLEGASAVDESMLTGESLPVEKMPGARLYAGTLNQGGRLLARVTSVGQETALAQIIAAVNRAQSSRANIQRLGDRVSSVFVPVVVLVALGAALWWGLASTQAASLQATLAPAWWHVPPPPPGLPGAVFIAAAVLIVACPCAMGLATPAAIMAGSNAAARRGILIRDGIALEKAGGITTILLDKTGTLTEGKPAVAAIEFLESPGGITEFIPGQTDWQTPRARALLELAGALARPSAHPFSQAIAKLPAAAAVLADWTELRGAGVQARWPAGDGAKPLARLGSLRWLREAGADVGRADNFSARWLDWGATVLGLAVEDQLVAVFALTDTLKPGARTVIDQLRHLGLSPWLVTGDNAVTARSIAAQAGIAGENVFAGVRPEEKAALVRRLQEQGGSVAFVGDGINDAPALEEANLGIAVSRASDVAREAADLILLRSDLEAVPEALGLARATLRTIRQNLFWAFFYNAAAIPLAALGFMSPVLCAATMGLSDVVVIGNALRLLAMNPQKSKFKTQGRAGMVEV